MQIRLAHQICAENRSRSVSTCSVTSVLPTYQKKNMVSEVTQKLLADRSVSFLVQHIVCMYRYKHHAAGNLYVARGDRTMQPCVFDGLFVCSFIRCAGVSGRVSIACKYRHPSGRHNAVQSTPPQTFSYLYVVFRVLQKISLNASVRASLSLQCLQFWPLLMLQSYFLAQNLF